MQALDAPTLAALQQDIVPICQLVLMRLPGGDIALNTSNWDLVWDGITYRGAAGLGSIGEITDGSGEVRGLQFELSGASSSDIALALDAADSFQGSAVIVRTAILDATTYAIVAAPIEWSGYGDTFAISEDGERAAVAVTAESDQVDLLRGRPLTASDADHQSVYPGDRFCEYRQSQIGQPVVWPSKEFFYI